MTFISLELGQYEVQKSVISVKAGIAAVSICGCLDSVYVFSPHKNTLISFSTPY